jgi:hypothetical protein
MSAQKARVGIDALLVQAGWHVRDVANANIHAPTGVAISEFPLNSGFGFADYLLSPLPPIAEQVPFAAEVDRHLSIIREVEVEGEVDANLQRAQVLKRSSLEAAFATVETKRRTP